jgi:hypothetical protein
MTNFKTDILDFLKLPLGLILSKNRAKPLERSVRSLKKGVKDDALWKKKFFDYSLL